MSPWLGPETGREVTVFIEASAGPLGAGHCGLPYLPGAMQLFLGVAMSRLNYLLGGAAGSGVGELHAFL